MAIRLTTSRTGFPPGRFLRLNVLALVVLGGSSAVAQAQTVLERVLERIQVSGLFVNAAQTGFAARPARIDASITTLASPGFAGAIGGAGHARLAQSIALGTLESVALGATNAGDVILSVSVISAAAGSDPAGAGSLRGISPAAAILLGESAAHESRIDLVRVDDLIALSQSVASESWQTGTKPEATVALINLAANGGDVSARILTRVDGAVLDARDATTTALGAVNVGIARVIGDR